MEIQIKNRRNDDVIFEGNFENFRQAVETAVKNKVSLYGANLDGANLSRTDLSGANLIRANMTRADLSGANLSGANLRGANLSGANLDGADLGGANLRGADLTGADLCGANLKNTILEGKSIVSFQFERHQAVFYGMDEITIGCYRKTVKEWLETYKEVGRKEGYTDTQIERYGEFIRQCAGINKASESVFSRIYKTIRSKL